MYASKGLRRVLQVAAAAALATTPTAALCQTGAPVNSGVPSIVHDVRGASERIEMTVNQTRILTLDQKIPRAQVNNPGLLELTPLSENQISIHARAPGVTSVHIWGEDDQIHAIDVIVYGDVSELKMVLEDQFPNASLRVRALSNSVMLSGYVDQADHVAKIIEIAQDYYPRVVNLINVGGVQQVLLHVKVMEVSRTGLRRLATDYNLANTNGFLVGSVTQLINAAAGAGRAFGGGVNAASLLDDARLQNQTVQFGVFGNNSAFYGLIDALRKRDLVKVLAEPTLVTVSGRPAFFQEGGEFPIIVPQSLGTVSIEYKRFGTQVDFVPIVLGNGNIRLEVRPRVSELDLSRAVSINNTLVPALRVREADTGVEMRAGQTLAMAGLIQTKTESSTQGIPFLADLPYIGVPFRQVRENVEEIELLILVTPELVEAMDPNEVPPCGPGMETAAPDEHEFYLRGHLEVPVCNDCSPMNAGGQGMVGGGGGYGAGPQAGYGAPNLAPTQGGVPQGSIYEGLPPGARIIDSQSGRWEGQDLDAPTQAPTEVPQGGSANANARSVVRQTAATTQIPQDRFTPQGRPQNPAAPAPGRDARPHRSRRL